MNLIAKKIAAAWASRGFDCDLWADPPGQSWEGLRYSTDELVTVMEGSMEFEVDGEIHHPKVGEELLIPAGTIHSARNIGTTRAAWLYGYKRAFRGEWPWHVLAGSIITLLVVLGPPNWRDWWHAAFLAGIYGLYLCRGVWVIVVHRRRRKLDQ